MQDLWLQIYSGSTRTFTVLTVLTVGVEVIRTGAPRQLGLERRIEVEYDPGDDDHVIDGDHRYNDQRAVTETWSKQSEILEAVVVCVCACVACMGAKE